MSRRVLTVLLLVFALLGAGMAELSDDCGLDDFHDGALCGCACHHVGLLAGADGVARPALCAPLPPRGPTDLPHRSERPVLRPPIG